MFKLNDRVIEVGTNTRGVVIDLDDSIDKPYGVLFEDVDEDNGVWWCDSSMIREYKCLNHEQAARLSYDKVGYYWDSTFPVIEVFTQNKNEAIEKVKLLNEKIKHIKGNSFEIVKYSENYCRIIYTFSHSDFDLHEFAFLVEELRKCGKLYKEIHEDLVNWK